jgi:hypothetical protein
VLVAGDSDYVPTIKELRQDGFTVEVVFWNHASRELKEVASKFIGLDSFLETLRLLAPTIQATIAYGTAKTTMSPLGVSTAVPRAEYEARAPYHPEW